MSSRAYVGVDPGTTTGIAMLETDGTFRSWEDDWETAVAWVEWMAEPPLRELPPSLQVAGLYGSTPELSVVVVEDFIVNRTTHQKTREPEVVWAIGALKWLSRGRFPMYLSNPSVKHQMTAAHLQAAGWWHPSSGHARDAARHLLAHCLRSGIMQESFTDEGALRIEYAT